jgi:methylmalonyl-CoA/ethylmalonyl-CoA epimerase
VTGLPFKFLGVDHCGLAPKNAATTRDFFSKILKLPFVGEELVAEQKTNTIIFSSASHGSDNPTRLEILEDRGQGPVFKFLEKKGAGVHHIAIRVDNVDAAFHYLKAQGVRIIDEKPKAGAHHTKIFFIHPESTGGLLIEFVQNLE